MKGGTGRPSDRLADLIGRVCEIADEEWEKPPVGRPHVLPLPTAVIAVLFGLRHNMSDEVVAGVFGCSQARVTRYHQIL
ncbi:transposase family protein [Salinispora sp. H7-4]|uniref:transposase family protein n=1 Tax=Salinispora sp. H7-4 TaxID=2748321 RepID=UPI002104A653|nr:transposase family protein [Salinispora sp. H7-4]